MNAGFLIAALFVRYLKKSLRLAEVSPRWDARLQYVLIGSIGLMVVSIVFGSWGHLFNWLSHAILLYLLYILISEKEFSGARSYVFTLAPYIVTSVFADFSQLAFRKFYNEWDSWFDAAVFFSFVWLLLSIFMNRKQQMALQKEQAKTAYEEEQNKIMARMKAGLEVQVKERTLEITRQKEELQAALDELRATQSQLIQSEKMASLGELTAGIAHEIQNPLNFVNNFSELGNELIDEMNAEIEKGDMEEAKAIAADLKQNLEKINHHGKRADAIVKGMLQHSRSSTGVKEKTDINKLADEYFRLAYHGLRAKDKSFNATLKTEYAENLEPIHIVPQDIGRVILNLITNAFYAVNQKKKELGSGYEPTVTVSTKKYFNALAISVKDNGKGIPQHILEKIFQPFFTTKPTGHGTGLGLSMSYDIIVKGHGGEIKVNTKEGEGSEFTIWLPDNKI